MKRTIIALLLLIGCVGAAVFELNYIRQSADDFLLEIEELDGNMRRGDEARAGALSDKLERDWGDWVQTVDILLIHDYVDSVSTSLARMKSHIQNGSAPQYFSESAAVKKAIVSISDSELPKWENIL